MFNYTDDDEISVSHKELMRLHDTVGERSKVMMEWFIRAM